MDYKVIKLNTAMHEDTRYGGLCFFEGERDIPFAIRRVFCVFETEAGIHRGFHAHKRNWQLLFCPYGSIDIIMDDGACRETVTLDEPSKGLILNPSLWHEMLWNRDGSILCVAASEYYDPNEYIRDYEKFLEHVGKNNKNK